MLNTLPRAWDNLPLRLTSEEILDPHETIRMYFSAFNIQQARRFINKWFESVCESKPGKMAASDLHFFYERTESLIEAAFLIVGLDNWQRKGIVRSGNDDKEFDAMNPCLFTATSTESTIPQEIWEAFPRSLSYKEFINPYLVFRKFCSFLPLGQWRAALHEIFTMAISRRSFQDETLDFNIVGMKRNLEKLMDASHLIDVREYRQALLNKITDDSHRL